MNMTPELIDALKRIENKEGEEWKIITQVWRIKGPDLSDWHKSFITSISKFDKLTDKQKVVIHKMKNQYLAKQKLSDRVSQLELRVKELEEILKKS